MTETDTTAPAQTNVTVNTDDGSKTFTQADVDRIAGERAQRERAKYQDYNDLKASAAKLAKIEEANASETEKAVKAARDEGRNEVLTAANQRLVNAEARALAAEARARNPAIAVRSLDLSGVKVADDGTVDAAAIKAMLDELQKSDGYLFGDPPVVNPNMDGGVRPTVDLSGNPRAADLAQIEADIKVGSRRK